jgi:ABC-type antimicrobial peptide transport system permease subunit
LVPADAKSPDNPALLSASAARMFFPKQDAVGQILRHDRKTNYRIVGIVEDAKYTGLRDQSSQTLYPYLKPNDYAIVAVRSSLDKYAVAAELRQLLKQTGKNIRLGTPITMTEQIDQTLVTERLIALLASFFAVVAGVLVAVGLYGVVGYSAARRTSEIGVRLALGATRESVRWLMMREALLLSSVGVIVGIPAAIVCSRIARSMLYNVSPHDPALLAVTVALVFIVTAVSAFIPALRASRLDPMRALRYE